MLGAKDAHSRHTEHVSERLSVSHHQAPSVFTSPRIMDPSAWGLLLIARAESGESIGGGAASITAKSLQLESVHMHIMVNLMGCINVDYCLLDERRTSTHVSVDIFAVMVFTGNQTKPCWYTYCFTFDHFVVSSVEW